ncbi:E3 ubiquitin-protein ligase TRAF7-like isoform X2 [Pomacea canaliculata]|uniref:E3 ubiquitin-protein ligase TRAF7-like isoform X2 n=1 Tax=Pomacea canaliculata TaxID=400727 RepID=UPI000D73EB10|nr:E3 ubiquitin-protein ligase TRAF7-like isoform X2 [Pomacea canaliculata]
MEEVEGITKFVEEVSPYLRCPVCQKVYRDPVISKCGHTFCRQCVSSITHCPVDTVQCDNTQLVVNRLVVGQIESLQIYCKHGVIKKNGELIADSTGCPEITTLGDRAVHEGSCPYAYVSCPNGANCGRIRHKDLDLHLTQCTFIACAHKKKGCEFVGAQNEVDEHLLTCYHRGSLSDSVTEEINIISKENDSLKSQMKMLNERVYELEKFKQDANRQLEKTTSLLISLQQQIDQLTSRLPQALSSNPQHHHRSPSISSQSEITGVSFKPHHARRSSSPSGVSERWEMPFQFKCIGTLRGHQDAVWCLCAFRGRLFSAGGDCVIKVWNLDQLAKGCVGSFHGHTDRILCMAKYGSKLFTAGADYTIRCWDTETGDQIETREGGHDNIICAMAITGDFIFTSSLSVIKVWKIENLSLIHTMGDLNHWVRALVLSPSKDRLYSGSHNAINIWEASGSFESLGTISHDAGSVYSLAVTRLYVIAGTYNRNIHVFSASTHEFVTHLSSHIGTVTSLVTSLSGRFLFSASQDSNIMIWNLETMLPIQTLSRHQGQVNTLALCGNYVLSGSEDHEIKVFRYFQLQ